MPRLSTIARAATLTLAIVAGASGARCLGCTGARVFVFVTSDCPISNGYAPEIRRVCEQYRTHGVSCTLVYEDVGIGDAAVKVHQAEYGTHTIPAAIDRDRAIARRMGATVTPQAVVVDSTGAVRYRGRIDNRYAALGKPRRQITQRDLRDALDAVLAGRPVPIGETEALGCFIPPSLVGIDTSYGETGPLSLDRGETSFGATGPPSP